MGEFGTDELQQVSWLSAGQGREVLADDREMGSAAALDGAVQRLLRTCPRKSIWRALTYGARRCEHLVRYQTRSTYVDFTGATHHRRYVHIDVFPDAFYAHNNQHDRETNLDISCNFAISRTSLC